MKATRVVRQTSQNVFKNLFSKEQTDFMICTLAGRSLSPDVSEAFQNQLGIPGRLFNWITTEKKRDKNAEHS